VSVDPRVAFRLRRAWNALSADQRARLEPHIQIAHQGLVGFIEAGKAPKTERTMRRELLFVQTVLSADEPALVRIGALAATQVIDPERVSVDSEGNIWGFGKYQLLDPGWLEAAVVLLENLAFGDHFPFGKQVPVPITIPNTVRIVLAGDFGTGDYGGTIPAPGTKIRKFIPSLRPHITVHLGDVYYAGTEGSEQANLVSLWPAGSLGSFTLNSNHEMYPGGNPYFREALASDLFASQNKRSFFLLENDYWTIVGLDSAYHSDPLDLYMNGTLDTEMQVPFLQEFGNQSKNLLILTHHNGLNEDGRGTTGLWDSVIGSVSNPDFPTYWYWGHVHVGCVYTRDAGNGAMCRCIGHSALPCGRASVLDDNSSVLWHEERPASDPDDMARVLNGFACFVT
jgi:hypothetical protein